MKREVPVVISLLLFTLPAIVTAQLSPGDLSRSHKHLEGLANCQKCHALEKQIDPEKCLGCHKLLNDRIKSNQGLHARPEYNRCQTCHAEHNGRDFQLIWWRDGVDNFDHKRAGYELNGKHARIDCRKCHRAENITEKVIFKEHDKDLSRTFLGLSQNCLSCHPDQHGGQLAQSCEQCHSTEKWKPVEKFNHDQTRYRLTGSHRKVPCNRCHPVDKNKIVKFRPLQFDACSDCHRDPHQSRLGKNCSTCHTTASWRGEAKRTFDHERTRYPLRGKHQLVSCEQCHPPYRPVKEISFAACTDCHRDYHRGAFKQHRSRGECAECHTLDGFKPSTFGMSEHQMGDYPLEGAHRAVPCDACHRHGNDPPRFSYKNRDCEVCHKNPHGQEARVLSSKADAQGCAFCHSFSSWQTITYDHERTRFPLKGKHASIRCSACHKQAQRGVLLFSGLNGTCEGCHSDVHHGQFKKNTKTDCSSCHVPQDWLAEKFVHNHDSRFKLEGAHRFVECIKCHPLEEENGKKFRRYKPLETACASCHTGEKHLKEKS